MKKIVFIGTLVLALAGFASSSSARALAAQQGNVGTSVDSRRHDAQENSGALPSKVVDRRNQFDLQVSTVVHFDVNSDVLRPDALATLDSHVQYLNANLHRKITLEGFTDPTASRSFNLALSRRRVEAVRRYLLQSGLPAVQIESEQYFGPDRPAAKGAAPADYAKNRRVELRY